MKCRFCKSENLETFVDLGHTAISNSFLSKEQLNQPEVFWEFSNRDTNLVNEEILSIISKN